MKTIREWLKGKKTYIVCAGAILATVLAWSVGDVELADAVKNIVEALAGITIRAAIE